MGADGARAAARGSPLGRQTQLSLFGDHDPARVAEPASELARARLEAERTVAALPASVRLGTSSWSFPGWKGLVYSEARTPGELARDGLREYAQHPLFRTIGVDRSYYAPIPTDDLARYAEQLPEGFPCCFKAPASATSVVTPAARGMARALRNPDFLSAERLSADLLEGLATGFRSRTGPIVVECAPLPRGMALSADEFAERLDAMLDALPREFRYAVEIRTQAWLTTQYLRVLARHGAAHVHNYWSAMPRLAEQARLVAPHGLPFQVVRLLLRPGTWYEDQRERFKPFDRIVEADEPMREEVVDLVAASVRRAVPAYVLVNNKAEGSAPLTIAALAARIVERLADDAAGGQVAGEP